MTHYIQDYIALVRSGTVQVCREQLAYIQDPAHKEDAAAALRGLEEDYAGWFIKRHRDRVDDLCCAISQHLRAANTIWPNYRFEFNDRRHELNQALKCCNMLQDELQYIAEALPADKNRYMNIVLEIQSFLEREVQDEITLLVAKYLLREIFQTFEVDVSRFSDEEIMAMMHGKVDPMLNANIPPGQLPGLKMLRKGVDIGSQPSQNIGIIYPYRLDNFAKIVCGIEGYGRYTDDFFATGESKEFLRQVLEGFHRIADEYGLIINPRKTRIVKLSSEFRHLQISYSLTETGRVVRKINPKNMTRERRKLKAYKRLLDAGTIDYMTVENSFKSWLGGHWKIMSHIQIYNMSNLYFELFGRRPKVDGIFGSETAARILEVIASGEHFQTQAPADDPEDTDGETGTFWDHIRYFTREEFRCRCGNYHAPYCNGFPVEPDETLVEMVDDIRAHFGRPAHPSSGIRCERHNADQPGAAANSKHKRGKALDFFIEGVSGETLRAYATADPRCTYAYVISGNYVHVDVE